MTIWNFIVTHIFDEGLWIAVGAGGLWLLNRIFPELIKFSYNQRLEVFKRKILQREKVSIISELVVLIRKQALNSDEKARANLIMVELALYLPRDIVVNLAHTLKHDGTNEDIGWSELFGDIRDFMNGNYDYNKKNPTKMIDRVVGDNVSFVK